MERRLKDYKGFGIIKEVEENGKKKDIYYYLLDENDNIINTFRTLPELKRDVDLIWA